MDNEFRNSEIGSDPADEKFENWIHAVGKLMAREIDVSSQLASDLFDYYTAGYTEQQAADEILIAEEAENKKPRKLKIINRHGVESDVDWPFD